MSNGSDLGSDTVVGVRSHDAVRKNSLEFDPPCEIGALRRQWHERDVGRYRELVRQVPSRLVDEECGVTARRDGCGDLGQVQVHRLGIASRQDERCTLAKRRTDGSEDVGLRSS